MKNALCIGVCHLILNVPCICLQAAMVAKLEANAEQAATKGLPLDDGIANSDESGDESSPSVNQSGGQAAEGPGAGRAPARKRAEKPSDAAWQSACRLPGASVQMQVRAADSG